MNRRLTFFKVQGQAPRSPRGDVPAPFGEPVEEEGFFEDFS
jgi:hypothetical protein